MPEPETALLWTWKIWHERVPCKVMSYSRPHRCQNFHESDHIANAGDARWLDKDRRQSLVL